MDNTPETKKNGAQTRHKVLTIVGIVLCALLLPILIINCIMIVQSMVNEDEVPGIGGYSPLIVRSGSMDPVIKIDDIIIVKEIDAEDIKEGDVISFFDPRNETSVITHRVVRIVEEADGSLTFKTWGDANIGSAPEGENEDPWTVTEAHLIGIWTKTRIPLVGGVAMFMQTTGGLIVCVFVPLALLVGYDVLRRRKADQGKKDDVEALMKELEALKAAQAAGTNSQGESTNRLCEGSEASAPQNCHCEQSEAISNNEVNE